MALTELPPLYPNHLCATQFLKKHRQLTESSPLLSLLHHFHSFYKKIEMVDYLKCYPFSGLPDFISAMLKIQEIPSTNLINRANEKAIFVLDNSAKEMNNLARIDSLPSRHCVHCFRIEISRKLKIILLFVKKQKKKIQGIQDSFAPKCSSNSLNRGL
jgi:hypothetical protein